MLNVQFRALKFSDIEIVQQLVDELFNAYPAEEGAKPDIGRTFAEFDRYPTKGKIIVFEYEEQIIGYAILVFVWTNEFGSDITWVDELVVNKKYRGLGVGKTFFNWLQYTEETSPAFSLLVSENNIRARRFYEEIGFKSMQLQMLKVNLVPEQSNMESSPIARAKELIEAA